jgi:hypothetical protein
MARQDNAAVYGPWQADMLVQGSGALSMRIVLEATNGTILSELAATTLNVRDPVSELGQVPDFCTALC